MSAHITHFAQGPLASTMTGLVPPLLEVAILLLMNRTPFLLFIATLTFATTSMAQYQPRPSSQQRTEGTNMIPHRATYDIGAKVGSFLPYGIVGVRNLLQNWGVRLGHSIGPRLRLEYSGDFADQKGVKFYSAYASLRYNFRVLDTLPMYALFGGDVHHYKRINTRVQNLSFPFETVAGYHVGLGAEYNLFSGIFARADVRMGFRPGRQVSANIGLSWRFGRNPDKKSKRKSRRSRR